MFVIVMIVVVLTVIPRQINKLYELSKQRHGYMHSYDARKRSRYYGGHVIVTGAITYDSVAEFLREFYHSRRGRVHMEVVVMSDQVPPVRLQHLLESIQYRRLTVYLKGSLVNEKDCERAQLAKADAVFLLASKKGHRRHVETEDALTVLQALAVDKFRFRYASSSIAPSSEVHWAGRSPFGPPTTRQTKCFLQLLSPQHNRGLQAVTGVQEALNTTRLLNAILARSVVCPGAAAFIMNLIYSADEQETAQAQRSRAPWVREYAMGMQHQIHPVFLTRAFHLLRFEDAAAQLYDK